MDDILTPPKKNSMHGSMNSLKGSIRGTPKYSSQPLKSLKEAAQDDPPSNVPPAPMMKFYGVFVEGDLHFILDLR